MSNIQDWSYKKDMPREQAHSLKYGTTETPPRGTGRGWVTRRTVENLSLAAKILGIIAAAGGVYLLLKKPDS